jgi:hypothetical protein
MIKILSDDVARINAYAPLNYLHPWNVAQRSIEDSHRTLPPFADSHLSVHGTDDHTSCDLLPYKTYGWIIQLHVSAMNVYISFISSVVVYLIL